MSNLSNDIQLAISKNLNAEVADELKLFISKSQEQERDLTTAIKTIAELNKTKLDLQTRIKSDTDLELLQASVDASKISADASLAEAFKKQVEVRALIAEAKVQVYTSVFDKVFANTVVRNNVQSSVPTVVPPTYSGGPSGVVFNTATENSTRTTE